MGTEAESIIEAFCLERAVADKADHRFGSPPLRVEGVCDGVEGVQWNAWVEWNDHEQAAFAGVNLEGMKYDGWPVGRLIERELESPSLFAVVPQVTAPERVQVMWYRDAWQAAARPAIAEKIIGGSPQLLHRLTREDWRAMLTEALACLGPGGRGRGRQSVTVKRGAAMFDVSPHLQFRRALWPRVSTSAGSWQAALRDVFAHREPLHAFVLKRSAL